MRTEITCVNMTKYLFQEILAQEEIANLGKEQMYQKDSPLVKVCFIFIWRKHTKYSSCVHPS